LSVNTPSKFFSKKISYKIFIGNKKVFYSTYLTIWNKPLGITSMYQKSILTREKRNLINLTPRIRSILVGIILSDGWLQKRKGWNPRIGLKQSIINFEYLWHTFNEISILCSNYPYITKNIKRGKLFYALQIETRQLQCLIEIYNLFYKFSNIKCIKSELYNYLDYLALAHWIMGDGSKRNKGITLCTDSFTIQEVVLLINILIIKFNIKPTIHKEKKNYRIYINNSDLNKILPFIKPYFINSFLYKIS